MKDMAKITQIATTASTEVVSLKEGEEVEEEEGETKSAHSGLKKDWKAFYKETAAAQ